MIVAGHVAREFQLMRTPRQQGAYAYIPSLQMYYVHKGKNKGKSR